MHKNQQLNWLESQQIAFKKFKEEIKPPACNTLENDREMWRVTFGIGRIARIGPTGKLEDGFASRFLNVATLKNSTNVLERIGLVWAVDHLKSHLLSQLVWILINRKLLIKAKSDDKFIKIAQSQLKCWADKLLPYGFTVKTDHLGIGACWLPFWTSNGWARFKLFGQLQKI